MGVKNEIQLIMESILTLFIVSPGIVESIVAVCCLRNLLKMNSNDIIQNVNSDQQLLEFATNIFKTWMTEYSTTTKRKGEEQTSFNTLMNITHKVFKQKGYNIESYNTLRSHY